MKALAYKIHDTEINHEIDPYLEEINLLLEDTSKGELIKSFFLLNLHAFLIIIRTQKNLNSPKGSDSFSEGKQDDQSARFFINIGKKDGYDWMSMKDFLGMH